MKPESIIHLWDCRFAQYFWNSFPSPIQATLFYGANLLDWLRLNFCSSKPSSFSDVDWGILFSFRIWSLRLQGNSVIFRNKRSHRNLKAETLAKAMEFTFIGINSKLTCSHTNMKANRLRPPVSWYKLNWDGSSLGNPGLAGGGLIWNDLEIGSKAMLEQLLLVLPPAL